MQTVASIAFATRFALLMCLVLVFIVKNVQEISKIHFSLKNK